MDEALVALRPLRRLVWSVLWIRAVLTGVQWCLVFTRTSLVTWCVACFCLLPHRLKIFGEVSGKVFGPFFNLVVFLLLSLKSFCIFWIIVLCQICYLQIFSPSLVCLLIVLTVSFANQKILISINSNLSIISFLAYVFGVVSRSHCQTHGHLDFVLYYLLGVLYFTFRSVIRFEVILWRCKICVRFIITCIFANP